MIFQTNLGPMTAEQIGDEFTYGMFKRNRDLGISAKRLGFIFGDVPCELMESRYLAERRAA